MNIYRDWARSNPDAASRRLLELEKENAALRDALDYLCDVADSAMREANRNTAYKWEIEEELETARSLLAKSLETDKRMKR